MRLIDADEISGFLSKLDALSSLGTIRIKSIIDLINRQPTVYDIDKIVEQLEELKAEKEIGSHKVTVKEAIEIVKRGGIDE